MGAHVIGSRDTVGQLEKKKKKKKMAEGFTFQDLETAFAKFEAPADEFATLKLMLHDEDDDDEAFVDEEQLCNNAADTLGLKSFKPVNLAFSYVFNRVTRVEKYIKVGVFFFFPLFSSSLFSSSVEHAVQFA